MSKLMRFCLVLFAACMLAAGPLTAEEGNSGPLVSTSWLAKNLSATGIVVLDASAAPAYAAQHIPGAVNVNVYALGLRELPPATVERMYQSWGVSAGKKIVAYDEGGTYSATRLLYALLRDGFPAQDLALLDGGLAKWQKEGLPVTKDAPAPPPGTFTISARREDLQAGRAEVLTASSETANYALLEALGPDWHFGQTAAFDRPGHIPNGILLPSDDFFNPDKTFKSPDEIKRMLAYARIRPQQHIITYCGAGFAASVPFFALKFLLGYPSVKLYAGSEMDWLSDERGLPYWTYDAPFLMRRAAWLQFWGGPRLRMFGVGNVSIIDIRPPAEYDAGHVPFALNLPAATFAANLHDPEKLAAILGPAGVHPGDEAVIVSGAGLTKEAALAFLVLEKLGQHKVSVLVDAADKWAAAGLPPTKEPTVVGAKKSPRDLPVAPAEYTARLRDGILVPAARTTGGLYPTVYIASGRQMPAQAPPGKVVLLPFGDLLNPDGTPKEAKDLWQLLNKAGVPRYAELVCVSDDPAEAAANYYLLQLMGYPDVKVLLR